MSTRRRRSSVPTPGAFHPCAFGGISITFLVPGLAPRRLRFLVRVFDPTMNHAARALAEKHFHRASFIGTALPVFSVGVVGWLLAGALFGRPVTGAVTAAVITWYGWRTRSSLMAEKLADRVATRVFHLHAGRRRFLKADEPPTWTDPAAVAALSAVGDVGDLAQDGLIPTEQWDELYAELWSAMEQTPGTSPAGSDAIWSGLLMSATRLLSAVELTDPVEGSMADADGRSNVWPLYADRPGSEVPAASADLARIRPNPSSGTTSSPDRPR